MSEKTNHFTELDCIPVEWLKSVPTPMFTLDKKGRIDWCNDTFVELTGYDRGGIIGARLDTLFGQRNVADLIEDLLHLYRGQRFAGKAYDLLRQSGTTVHATMNLTPIFGEGEESELIVRVFGLVKDFTPIENGRNG